MSRFEWGRRELGLAVTGALALFVLVQGAMWSSSLQQPSRPVGAGSIDPALLPPRPERMSGEEERMLRKLGYMEGPAEEAPPPAQHASRRRAERPGDRRARSGSDDELRNQLQMLGYYVAQPQPSPSAEVRRPLARRAPGAGSGSVHAIDQPLSTFAADVDDASWVHARDELASGQNPRAESIRVEEFVNAMPYDYPQPDGVFGVSTEIVQHPDKASQQLVRIGVQGRRAVAERPPLNLTFLIDTSGSMRGSMPMLIEALGGLVDQLEPRDTVSIVEFSVEARVLLEPTRMTRSGQASIRRAVEGLQAAGGTGMDNGLSLAYQQAQEHHREGAVSRVVLVSDGDANHGEVDGLPMAQGIREQAKTGILLTALGVSTRSSGDRILEELSNHGDGQYFALRTPEDAQRTLVRDFTSTFVPLATDVKLQMEWDPDVVRSYRLVGYDNRRLDAEDFRADGVDAGEVGVGHQVTALYVIERLPGHDDHALGGLRVRAKEPGPDGLAVESATVIHGPVAADLFQASWDTQVAVAAASLGLKLRGDAPLVPLPRLEALLGEEEVVVEEHQQLLEALRRVLPAPVVTRPSGISGVVSLQVEPATFERVKVSCPDRDAKQASFVGGRAMVSGLPEGPCVADLGGGRSTVTILVEEGRSYRCDGDPLRCREES